VRPGAEEAAVGAGVRSAAGCRGLHDTPRDAIHYNVRGGAQELAQGSAFQGLDARRKGNGVEALRGFGGDGYGRGGGWGQHEGAPRGNVRCLGRLPWLLVLALGLGLLTLLLVLLMLLVLVLLLKLVLVLVLLVVVLLLVGLGVGLGVGWRRPRPGVAGGVAGKVERGHAQGQ